MFRSVTDRTHGILHTIFFLSDQRLHYSEKYYSCGKSAADGPGVFGIWDVIVIPVLHDVGLGSEI